MILFTDKELIISKFPMSISTNHLYKNSVRGIRYKQKAYIAFENQVEMFFLQQLETKNAKKFIKDIIKNEETLFMDMKFYVDSSRCFTKKDTIKRHDIFNFIKSAHDTISRELDFDDRFIWSGTVEKIPTTKDEFIEIRIRKHE